MALKTLLLLFQILRRHLKVQLEFFITFSVKRLAERKTTMTLEQKELFFETLLLVRIAL